MTRWIQREEMECDICDRPIEGKGLCLDVGHERILCKSCVDLISSHREEANPHRPISNLNEAIEHSWEKSLGEGPCAQEHRMLHEWLGELRDIRGELDPQGIIAFTVQGDGTWCILDDYPEELEGQLLDMILGFFQCISNELFVLKVSEFAQDKFRRVVQAHDAWQLMEPSND